MRAANLAALLVITLAQAFAPAAHAESPGAIGTLHGARHHRHRQHRGIEIPRYVRHIPRPSISLPPGTSRPGPSRHFIPAQ